MNYIKKLALAFVMLIPVALSAANTKGSNIKNPAVLSVGRSMAATLVDEYDPEFKENSGWGVYYIKVSLRKGNAYTIWCTGGNTSDIDISVDVDWDDESAPFAYFEPSEKSDGATKIEYLYADSWDEDDPATGTYYIQLSGEIGAKTTVNFVQGIQDFSVEGEESSPRRLVVTEAIQTEVRTQVSDGDYYYVMNLQKGLKYRFWAVGAQAKVVIVPDRLAELSPRVDAQYEVYFKNLFPSLNPSNGVGYVVFPSETGDYVFNMSTMQGESQAFAVLYQAFRQRKPEQHHDDWSAYTLVPGKGGDCEKTISPGRLGTDDVYYYDSVIDETLCRIALKKGERWIFDGKGAAEHVLMRVYDKEGAILSENETIGNGSRDVRAVVTASYDGWYYVGICNPNLAWNDEPSGATVTLTARNFDSYAGQGDAFDPTDDSYPTATIIDTFPGSVTNDITEVGSLSGPHTLGPGDWQDWYCFAGRKYMNYRIKAAYASEEKTDLTLAATVYKMVNGAVSVVSTIGGLTPYDNNPDLAPLSFTADSDGMYYVCVTVKEGIGLDYPAYNLHAIAYLDGYDFGLVRVNTMGTEGSWSLEDLVVGKSTVALRNGTSLPVIVDPTGTQAVRNVFRVWYNDAKDYRAPSANLVYDTPMWTGNNLQVLDGYYWDASDPKDDTFAGGGYTVINPVAAESSLSRTLWVKKQFAGSQEIATDKEDEFAFLGQAGRYYNFALEDETDEKTAGASTSGDAVFTVYKYPDLTTPYMGIENVTKCLKRTFDGGAYYLIRVRHASPAGSERDSCYKFKYSSVNVGTVQFEKAAVVVTEKDAYAELKVTRTAAEGSISVKYVTQEGTAKPHEDYYPTTSEQVLSWAHGDATAKTIRIRLVPNLVAQWESNKVFTVEMCGLSADTLEEGEYQAILAGSSTATVTIASAVPASAGTVTLLDQPLEVAAGDSSYHLSLERTEGAQGAIAVALYTTPGTAVEGSDYKTLTYTVVEWADGEEGVKEVPFVTYDSTATAVKTVKIGLVAVNGDYRSIGLGDYRDCVLPQLAANSATVSIKSQVANATGSLIGALSAQNIAIATPLDSWYVDAAGLLRNTTEGGMARVAFTVDGPGFLVVEPNIIDDPEEEASLIYLVGSGAVQTVPRADLGKPLVMTVSSGRTTVLMQVNGSGSSYLSLGKLDNGLPLKWIPLSSMSPENPLAGAMILQQEVRDLAWRAPVSAEGKTLSDIWYRVKLGTSAGATVYDSITEGLVTSGSINETLLATLNSIVDKLSVGKSQRFWWRVECAYSDDVEPDFKSLTWIAAPSAWSFGMLHKDSPATLVSGKDVRGNIVSVGHTVELVQGVPFESALSASEYDPYLNISGCVGGMLPPGLSAAGKKISGVPSVAGDFTALVEVGSSAYMATTIPLTFHVSPMNSAAGSFYGALQECGSATPNAFLRNLGLNVSANPDGSISAAVLYNGGRLVFSGANGYEDYDPDGELFAVTLANGNNKLELAIRGLDREDPTNLVTATGEAKLTLHLPDAGVLTERTYKAVLVRADSDYEAFVNKVAEYAGSYTIVLRAIGPVAGEPAGNGLVVLTVGDDGVTKATGILADGSSFTCSAVAGFASDSVGEVLRLPVWGFAGNYSFSALIGLRKGAEGVYVDSYYSEDGSTATWTKDGASSTLDGTGFKLELNPVGGWYDTVVNLQRYYLEYDFVADTEPLSGVEKYLLPARGSYVAASTPSGLSLVLNGNSLNVPALSFTMDGARIDLEGSVNPWGMTVSFNRALGFLSGTFNVISDDGSSQGYIGSATYRNLLLMTRDPKAPLDVDVQASGFYLLKVTDNWSLSQPFNIHAVGGAGYLDWSEAPLQK